jgi:NDP-sugar pyrophosphorylase family protein
MPLPQDALVLAAGLGTRLGPLTSVRAKPAIPIDGHPLIQRVVERLVHEGVMNVTVNLHHLPCTLTGRLGDGSHLGARVRYSWEQPVLLGSAGGPRLALDIIGAGTFFIVNGDTLTDVPLAPIAEAHDRSGALVTLALVPNEAPDKYGGVLLDDDGSNRVTGFVRRGAAAHGSYHFVGVQLVERRAFEPLPADAPSSSIGERYDALISAGPGSIRGVVMPASFWDVGTVADYWHTSRELGGLSDSDRGARVRIAPSASVARSSVWDDVTIGAGARIEECIVTDGVVVSPDAVYRREMLFRGSDGSVAAVPLPEDAR